MARPHIIITMLSSPLAQGRGLKHFRLHYNVMICLVAPRAGAWIETESYTQIKGFQNSSPPVRGRGLKLWVILEPDRLYFVAPRAGAWIETFAHSPMFVSAICRPPCGGVD